MMKINIKSLFVPSDRPTLLTSSRTICMTENVIDLATYSSPCFQAAIRTRLGNGERAELSSRSVFKNDRSVSHDLTLRY